MEFSKLYKREGKKSVLIGYNGFVGKNLSEQYDFDKYYNSSNIQDLRFESDIDFIVCCGISAVKWIANREPDKDWRGIQSLMNVLQVLPSTIRFVCISTIDVYPSAASKQNESEALDASPERHVFGSNSYGLHRLRFENFVVSHFRTHLIVRLPALFGAYLKKNYLYDLLHVHLLNEIRMHATLQFYPVSRLWADIQLALNSSLTLVNLFTEPIYVRELVERLFPALLPQLTFPYDASLPLSFAYDLTTQHASIFHCVQSPYMMNKESVFEELKSYIALEQGKGAEASPVRLVISNIAWAADVDEHTLALLTSSRISSNLSANASSGKRRLGLEIAPTRIAGSWNALSEEVVTSFLSKMNIPVCSMQAVLFECPALQLLESDASREALYEHLAAVCRLARRLRIRPIVFGAPKNRLLHGLSHTAAFEISRKFFGRIGAYAASKGVVLCLEANPPAYGCEFLVNAAESARMVRAVNSAGFRLHLDTACMMLGGDDPLTVVPQVADILCHVHISEPFLSVFGDFSNVVFHQKMAAALKETRYDGFLSIEMIKASDVDIQRALQFVSDIYTF